MKRLAEIELVDELLLLASRTRQEANLPISPEQRTELVGIAKEFEREAGEWRRLAQSVRN